MFSSPPKITTTNNTNTNAATPSPSSSVTILSNNNTKVSPVYLSIAEFDIDRGATVRSQLPSPIPVTSTYLSPMMKTKPTKSTAYSNNDHKEEDEAATLSWNQFLADQMMPDGSDRNARNTSWVILNRGRRPTNNVQPTNSQNNSSSASSSSGIGCCVFQMSSVSKWIPRACVLAVLPNVVSTTATANNDQQQQRQRHNRHQGDPILYAVDFFDYCKTAPTYFFSKQAIETGGSYRPIGRLSTIRIQAMGMLPAEKMQQVVQVCNQPPIRPKQEEAGFFQQLFSATAGDYSSSESPSSASNNINNNSSSSSGAGSGTFAPKAFANIIGDQCSSCGVAFLSKKDLENLINWVKEAQAQKGGDGSDESSDEDDEQTVDNNNCQNTKTEGEEQHQEDESSTSSSSSCLYGNIITVTKRMASAKRGSVNMSVCVCSSNISWLHSIRPFIETVAVACCDATDAPTKEEKLERIDKIAKSAYEFLINEIIPRVTAGGGREQANDIDEKNAIDCLSALAKRSSSHNYADWFKFITAISSSSSSFSRQKQQQEEDPSPADDFCCCWSDPNANDNKNVPSSILAPVYRPNLLLPLRYCPPPPFLSGIIDPSSCRFKINLLEPKEDQEQQQQQQAENSDNAASNDTNNNTDATTADDTTSDFAFYANQHSPLASHFIHDRNHLITSLIEVFGTEGLLRIIIHILLQRRCLVICRGGGGSRAAEAVMAIASLFEFFDDQFLAQRVIPYASVSLMDPIEATRGVLAGTVNPIFESRFGKGFDVLIDMDARLIKFGGKVYTSSSSESSSNNNNIAANGSSSSNVNNNNTNTGSWTISTFDCYKHLKSSKKNAFVDGVSGVNNSSVNNDSHHQSSMATTRKMNHHHQHHNNSSSKHHHHQQQQQLSHESSKSNIDAVCGGSAVLARWYEDLSNELHTLLLKRKNASKSASSMSQTVQVQQKENRDMMLNGNNPSCDVEKDSSTPTKTERELLPASAAGSSSDNETVSNSLNNNKKRQLLQEEIIEEVSFDSSSVEDEIRLTIVHEISILLWSLTRQIVLSSASSVPSTGQPSSSTNTIAPSTNNNNNNNNTSSLLSSAQQLLLRPPTPEIPLPLAESRIYYLGKWIGRTVPDPITFGFHVSRLLLPLDILDSEFAIALLAASSSSQSTAGMNGGDDPHPPSHQKHLLEEELIVSFLQTSVRTTANWKAVEWLQVLALSSSSTSFSPMQVLATLCSHKNSVIRLLASILLQKMRNSHPTIEQCASTQLSMFLHFVVDAAKMEFRDQLLSSSGVVAK